jgi:ATP-dependent Clp protease, protease subunit
MWIKVRSNSCVQYLNFLLPFLLILPMLLCTSALNILFCAQAKELDTNTDYYLELLSKGVGKPKEELAEFLRGPRYFRAQEALDYGLADTILHSLDGSFKPKVSC